MPDNPKPSIACPRCGMTSHNPNDVRERYCGNCHDWIADTPTVRLGARLDEYIAEAQRTGRAAGVTFTAEGILESLRRQGVSAQECERLRPDAEKLAKGLSLKASELPWVTEVLKASFSDGPYGVDGPIRQEDYEHGVDPKA